MMHPIEILATIYQATQTGLIPPVADIHYANQAKYPTHTVTTVTYASSDWWPDGPSGDAAPIMVQISIVHELATDEVTIPHQKVW